MNRHGAETVQLAEKFKSGWTITAAELAAEKHSSVDLAKRIAAGAVLRAVGKYLMKQDVPFGINGDMRKGYGVYGILKEADLEPTFAKTGTKLNRGVVRETGRMDVYVSNKPELTFKAVKEIQAATIALSNAIIKWSK